MRSMRLKYGPSLVFRLKFSPWISSCIGFHNRKPFILMLVYTIVATLIGIVSFLIALPTYW
jgi:hypothetical protein